MAMKVVQVDIDGQILAEERANTGTSWTFNKDFDKNGFLVIPRLLNPRSFSVDPPAARGQYNFYGNSEASYTYEAVETQVEGSLSRYNHPAYRAAHYKIKSVIESIIGRKLYPTYYYDRFYFDKQTLTPHLDRDACEISVSIHISSNLCSKWELYVKSPDTYSDKNKQEKTSTGEISSVILGPGDGLLYKGCECIHWRDKMPKPSIKETVQAITSPNTVRFYHQVFFHYVLQDGYRAHCAWDQTN